MMAMLIRSGHVQAIEYGYGFVLTCLADIEESMKGQILDMSFAMRMSGAEQKDWEKFVKNTQEEEVAKVSKKTSANDHKMNMARIAGLGR